MNTTCPGNKEDTDTSGTRRAEHRTKHFLHSLFVEAKVYASDWVHMHFRLHVSYGYRTNLNPQMLNLGSAEATINEYSQRYVQ